MKKSILILAGFILLFKLSCSKTPEGKVSEQSIESAEGDKVLIRLKPQVGDVQKTLMTIDVASEGGQEMNMKMRMNLDLKVTDKEEDVYNYQISYNSIKMNMSMGGMEMQYDSDAEKQEGIGVMMHEQMKQLLGKPVNMKMSDKGEVKEFSLPSEANNQQMGNTSSISLPLHDGPVGVGDSWTSVKPIESVGELKMKMTVDKITVDDVVIETVGDITDEAGTKVGEFSGDYTLNRNNGLTKDGTLNMSMPVEGNPMSITVNFKSL